MRLSSSLTLSLSNHFYVFVYFPFITSYSESSLHLSLISLVDIGVEEEQPVQFYKKEFQDPFVLATGEFYLKESTEFLQNNKFVFPVVVSRLRLVFLHT